MLNLSSGRWEFLRETELLRLFSQSLSASWLEHFESAAAGWQMKTLIFSTMPSIGTLILWAKEIDFPATARESFEYSVTIIAPSISDTSWAILRASSPVPGGKFWNSLSRLTKKRFPARALMNVLKFESLSVMFDVLWWLCKQLRRLEETLLPSSSRLRLFAPSSWAGYPVLMCFWS